MHKISRREWLWVIVASLLLMAITSVPYWIGLRQSTPEMRFAGFLFGLEDMYSYLAKMRYGTYNGLIFRLVYTTEPHNGGLVFTFHLLLGKLAALITGHGRFVTAEALAITYHIARIVCGFGLLLVMYRFIAEYLETAPERRLAWSIAALAGGLGWIATIETLMSTGQSGPLPVEFYVPEGFTLLLLYGLPHLALSRSLLLIGWLSLFRALDQHHLRMALLAGVAWLGMGILVPFYVALLGVLLATWLITLAIVQWRYPWQEFRLAAAASGLPLIVLIYNTWLFSSNPIFKAWSGQNTLPSPPIFDYLLAYGILIALSIPAVIALLKSRLNARTLLLLSWPLAAMAMVYLPINVQRRLLEGVIVPLSILAAMGLWRIVGPQPEAGPTLGWRLRQMAAGILLFMLFPSTALLIGGGALTAARHDAPIFHDTDEQAALNWLRENAEPGGIVMVTHDEGNILPAYAPVRVYLGHGPESINAGPKTRQAEAFFAGEMPPEQAREWLRGINVSYVWVGTPGLPNGCEAEICFDAKGIGLRQVFRRGMYTIFEVIES